MNHLLDLTGLYSYFKLLCRRAYEAVVGIGQNTLGLGVTIAKKVLP